jgi:hypothetical protein
MSEHTPLTEAERTDPLPGDLRSIANSIEPAFPDAAQHLRNLAARTSTATADTDEEDYCGAEFGEVRSGECECRKCANAYPDPLQDWPMPGHLKPDAATADTGLRERVEALEAAVERVRRRHPRGDEESGYLAPGLWCPTCGHERSDNGYGGCPDRQALIVPEPTEDERDHELPAGGHAPGVTTSDVGSEREVAAVPSAGLIIEHVGGCNDGCRGDSHLLLGEPIEGQGDEQ